MRRLSLAITLVAWVAVAGGQAVAGSDPAPFEAIRTLQRLQDQIAEGDAIAQAAHAKAIEHTAGIFERAPLSAWADRRNAHALIVYLFSGGSGPTVAGAVPTSALPPDLRTLYDGALAYSLGDDEKARQVLTLIDAKTLPSGIGGHLALVQATLCPDDARAKAIGFLDLARLLEPGTLIEEAALRKEMSLIGPTGDLDKYAFLARRYLSAFSRSVYADNFRQLVAATAMQIGASDSDEAGLRLTHLAATLDKADRRRLYLAIARAAVVAGHFRMAALSAEEAGRLSERDGPDEARAMVYLGAASIVGERYELGRKALDGVKPDRLGMKDRALRASAAAVADLIRRPAVPQDGMRAQDRTDVMSEGQQAMATADDLLKRAEQ